MNSDVGQEFRRDIPISNGNLGVLCHKTGGRKSTGGGFHCSGSTRERMGVGGRFLLQKFVIPEQTFNHKI